MPSRYPGAAEAPITRSAGWRPTGRGRRAGPARHAGSRCRRGPGAARLAVVVARDSPAVRTQSTTMSSSEDEPSSVRTSSSHLGGVVGEERHRRHDEEPQSRVVERGEAAQHTVVVDLHEREAGEVGEAGHGLHQLDHRDLGQARCWRVVSIVAIIAESPPGSAAAPGRWRRGPPGRRPPASELDHRAGQVGALDLGERAGERELGVAGGRGRPLDPHGPGPDVGAGDHERARRRSAGRRCPSGCRRVTRRSAAERAVRWSNTLSPSGPKAVGPAMDTSTTTPSATVRFDRAGVAGEGHHATRLAERDGAGGRPAQHRPVEVRRVGGGEQAARIWSISVGQGLARLLPERLRSAPCSASSRARRTGVADVPSVRRGCRASPAVLGVAGVLLLGADGERSRMAVAASPGLSEARLSTRPVDRCSWISASRERLPLSGSRSDRSASTGSPG